MDHAQYFVFVVVFMRISLSYADHYYNRDNVCIECNSTTEDGPCGRSVDTHHSSVTSVSCDGACQIRYHRNASEVTYRRVCAGEWCEEITAMEMVHPSSTNVGSVSIHRCCPAENCNTYLQEVRCYSCESGIKHGTCEDIISGSIRADFCTGTCVTIVRGNSTDYLMYQRICLPECPQPVTDTGQDDILALRCCKSDLCNGSDESLFESVQETLSKASSKTQYVHNSLFVAITSFLIIIMASL